MLLVVYLTWELWIMNNFERKLSHLLWNLYLRSSAATTSKRRMYFDFGSRPDKRNLSWGNICLKRRNTGVSFKSSYQVFVVCQKHIEGVRLDPVILGLLCVGSKINYSPFLFPCRYGLFQFKTPFVWCLNSQTGTQKFKAIHWPEPNGASKTSVK